MLITLILSLNMLKTTTVTLYGARSSRARRASAKHHGQGNPVTYPYKKFWFWRVRTYARMSSVQTLGEGAGNPKATRSGEENAMFSWREIARCFWGTIVFLGGKSHGHRRF